MYFMNNLRKKLTLDSFSNLKQKQEEINKNKKEFNKIFEKQRGLLKERFEKQYAEMISKNQDVLKRKEAYLNGKLREEED